MAVLTSENYESLHSEKRQWTRHPAVGRVDLILRLHGLLLKTALNLHLQSTWSVTSSNKHAMELWAIVGHTVSSHRNLVYLLYLIIAITCYNFFMFYVLHFSETYHIRWKRPQSLTSRFHFSSVFLGQKKHEKTWGCHSWNMRSSRRAYG